jgi:hypothetical protein
MFDWTSFGTGFAKAGSEKLDKDEEDAKALGAAQVKSLYENYASVVKENRTLSNDIKEKINVIRGFAPNASDDQLVALAQDRGILDMLSTRLKEKDFDATGFDINNFVTVAKSDSPYKAEERINQLFTIPSAVDSASQAFTPLTPAPAKQGFLSLITGSREGQTRAAAEQTAAALGIPLEKLQGAMGYKRDIKPSGASYDLAALKPGDTLDVSIDKAAVQLAAAQKKGDKKDVELAQANLDNFTKVKESLSSPQQQWLNKVSRLKDLEINGTPDQKKSAIKELDAIFAAEKRAELAKQLPKAERENMLAKLEIDAASDDPKVSGPAIAQLLKEAGTQAKVAEAKQTTTQQRDNYLADLELKAKGQRGTEAEQAAAQAKLVEMKKLDKLVAEAGQTATQARENRLAALRTKADQQDPAAIAELKQIAQVEAAIKEVSQTSVEKLAAKKAQLVIDVAAGNKDAEAELQAFFAVEKMEAEAKQGAAAQRTNRIAQLQMDAADNKPGAQEELNRALAVDDAAKKAEAEATKGEAQRRKDEMAALQRRVDAGDMSAKPQLDRMIALDTEAKVKEREALETDVSQRNNRIASYQTTITTSKDPAAIKEARAQLAKEMKLVADEARARQVPTAASDKVPSLSSLNTYVSAAITRAVIAAHGDQKGNMVFVDKVGADGVTYKDFEYKGGDEKIMAQIEATRVAAAKKAISVYTDNKGVPLNRDVEAIMTIYMVEVPPKAGGTGLGARPAAAAAVPTLKTTTTGTGAATVVTVIDPDGKPMLFKGANAASQAEAFKAEIKAALAKTK